MLYFRLIFFLIISTGLHVGVLFPSFLQHEKPPDEKLLVGSTPVPLSFIAKTSEQFDQGQEILFKPEQKTGEAIPSRKALLSTSRNRSIYKQVKPRSTDAHSEQIGKVSHQSAPPATRENDVNKRGQSISSDNQSQSNELPGAKSNHFLSSRHSGQKAQPINSLGNAVQQSLHDLPQQLPQEELLISAVPKKNESPLPEYPLIARKKNWEGVVWLLVDVSDRGEVVNLVVEKSCGYRTLDQSALQAVRQWLFTPAQNVGVPVKSQVRIPVRFQLEKT
jgi:TonB family protein